MEKLSSVHSTLGSRYSLRSLRNKKELKIESWGAGLIKKNGDDARQCVNAAGGNKLLGTLC